jgi:hypothetical protein
VAVSVPFQPPDATQLSASVELQLKVADWPCSMLEEDTERFTTGTGGGGVFTVTLTLSLILPPAPVQVRL